MTEEFQSWKVLDKRRFLLALMKELAGDARVSFEGDLRKTSLTTMPGAIEEPTTTLKRNTKWPKQDFVIVPLEPSTGNKIMAAIGGTVPGAILHIQIEKEGQLQFGAYDCFHPECIYFKDGIDRSFVDSMVAQGLIRPYTKRRPQRTRKRPAAK